MGISHGNFFLAFFRQGFYLVLELKAMICFFGGGVKFWFWPGGGARL